jgi:hypothetical protein
VIFVAVPFLRGPNSRRRSARRSRQRSSPPMLATFIRPATGRWLMMQSSGIAGEGEGVLSQSPAGQFTSEFLKPSPSRVGGDVAEVSRRSARAKSKRRTAFSTSEAVVVAVVLHEAVYIALQAFSDRSAERLHSRITRPLRLMTESPSNCVRMRATVSTVRPR